MKKVIGFSGIVVINAGTEITIDQPGTEDDLKIIIKEPGRLSFSKADNKTKRKISEKHPSPHTKPKKLRKYLWLILIVVLLIILAGTSINRIFFKKPETNSIYDYSEPF